MSAEHPILVTGITSYLGGHIVEKLLANNHHIRGTTRSLSSPNLPSLRSLPNSQNLSVVEADISDPSNFSALIRGCKTIVHVACPIFFPSDDTVPFSSMEDLEERQIRPAVEGTRELIKAAKKEGAERFVLTSSMLTMIIQPNASGVFNEQSWSDIEFLRANVMYVAQFGYCLAKTLQEKVAWDTAKEEGLELISLNPGCVLGPSISGRMQSTMDLLRSIAHGEGFGIEQCAPGTVPDAYAPFVDVRDVAIAHVLAVENKVVEGRYLLMSDVLHLKDIFEVVREVDGWNLGEGNIDKKEHPPQPIKVDKTKMRQLGVVEKSWKETIVDTAKQLIKVL